MTRERYVLGIDTAARLGSIALAANGTTLDSEPLAPGGHSNGLSSAAESLAWAKGLCLGSGIKLVLVSGHEAAAHAHRGEGGLVATVLQGERGEVVRLVAGKVQPGAAAVAELGDAKLLAGESADLASSAPAYGRSPNARKPVS